VGRGLGGLKPGKSFARQKHTLNKLCTRTVLVMAKSRRTGLASRSCRCFLAIEVGFLGPSLRLIAIGLKNLRGHSISRIEMAAGDTTVGSRPGSVSDNQ
jgi:hypothetical protein